MACLWVSSALWLGLTLCFGFAWDVVAVLTLYPFWLWAVLGGIVGLAAWRLSGNRHRLLLVPLIWAVTSLCFADCLPQVFRGGPSGDNVMPTIRVRVITLNCSGSAAAASEALTLNPDLVLLQEIPPTNELVRVARECLGDDAQLVAGFDCAIVARLPLRAVDGSFPPQHVQAVVELPLGRTALVTSLRLLPPEGRMDLWNPAAWSASTRNRRLRRQQLQHALERDAQHANSAEILGGDFNAPPNDAVFRLLDQFRDAFKESGHGWGNTALNRIPIARPDQIWFKQLRATSAHAVATRHSDHRMVVVDIELLQTSE